LDFLKALTRRYPVRDTCGSLWARSVAGAFIEISEQPEY
jgi:hypothetical protein